MISLVFLLLLTLIGITAMQSAMMQVRMAGNIADRNLAFQAAESALREGEKYIAVEWDCNPGPFDGSDGLHPGHDRAGAHPDAWSSRRFHHVEGTSRPAEYVIDELDAGAEPAPGIGDGNPRMYADPIRHYQVIARGFGRGDAAPVVLRATWRCRVDDHRLLAGLTADSMRPGATSALDGVVDFRFERLPGNEGASYREFLDGRPRILYVGVGNGMLHAFDADDGNELFAFAPDAAQAHLDALSSRQGFRGDFVDAPPRVVHAFGSGEWRSILIGSTGGGGQSVFALNVTDPEGFSSSDVLWEFTHDELGFTPGNPTIARLDNGRWAAIFGNGYNAGTARLFVVDLESGELLANVDTGVGGSRDPNGLVSVTPWDATGNRKTEYVYAGDLYGNLWKFDLTGEPARWDIAGNRAPLFTAEGLQDASGGAQRQPITVRPRIGRGPGGEGFMVYFGTGGRAHAPADTGSIDGKPGIGTGMQSIYGVWDNGTETASRDDLQEQTIRVEFEADSGDHFRVLSNQAVDYGEQRGWYLDLVSPGSGPVGEAVSGEAQLTRGVGQHRVTFTTATPVAGGCGSRVVGWLMTVDAYSGGRLGAAVFDVDGDGSIDGADAYTMKGGEPAQATGRRVGGGPVSAPLIMGDGSATEKVLMADRCGGLHKVEQSTIPDGRQGWQEFR